MHQWAASPFTVASRNTQHGRHLPPPRRPQDAKRNVPVSTINELLTRCWDPLWDEIRGIAGAGYDNIASALRHHARDPRRPLATYGIA